MEIPADITSVPETRAQPERYGSDDEQLERVRAEQLLRQYYDPRNEFEHESTDRLLDCAAATRAPIETLVLGQLSGHEVVLAEAIDLGLQAGIVSRLPIEDERAGQIVRWRQEYARHLAEAVVNTVEELTENWDEKASTVTLPSNVVIAGKFLAMYAHHGELRRNGMPFYSHPDEVASLFRMGWRRSSLASDMQTRDVVTFLCYVHDAAEDTIDKEGEYLASHRAVTPLVLSETLRLLDVQQSTEIARAALLMMRSHGVYGEAYKRSRGNDRMEYSAYGQRTALYDTEAGLFAMLAKNADAKNNRDIQREKIAISEPDSLHRMRKRRQYRALMKLILSTVTDKHPGYREHVLAVQRFTKGDVREDIHAKYVFDETVVLSTVVAHLTVLKDGATTQAD